MDVVIGPLIWLLNTVIELYIWVLIGSAILSWLVAFNVVNTRNRFVYMLGDFLTRITEPALRPIRRVIPSVGGIDLSPLVLILLLVFVQQILGRLYVAALIRG
ncbi:MAG: YggT family protein [Rhodospirillales bacterium]